MRGTATNAINRENRDETKEISSLRTCMSDVQYRRESGSPCRGIAREIECSDSEATGEVRRNQREDKHRDLSCVLIRCCQSYI